MSLPNMKTFCLSTVKPYIQSVADNFDKRLENITGNEELLNNVEEGKEVDIVPVADKSKVYTGTIDDIAQYAYKKDNGDTVIKLKVSFEDKEKFLGYGYHVEVRVKNE